MGRGKKTIDNGKALGNQQSCSSLCAALPSAGYSRTCSCMATASLTSCVHRGEDRWVGLLSSWRWRHELALSPHIWLSGESWAWKFRLGNLPVSYVQKKTNCWGKTAGALKKFLWKIFWCAFNGHSHLERSYRGRIFSWNELMNFQKGLAFLCC